MRELKGIVKDLKEAYNLNEGGCISVCSQGSRLMAHKRRALQKVIYQCGAYIAHFTSLCQNKSVISEDWAHLQGYVRSGTTVENVV